MFTSYVRREQHVQSIYLSSFKSKVRHGLDKNSSKPNPRLTQTATYIRRELNKIQFRAICTSSGACVLCKQRLLLSYKRPQYYVTSLQSINQNGGCHDQISPALKSTGETSYLVFALQLVKDYSETWHNILGMFLSEVLLKTLTGAERKLDSACGILTNGVPLFGSDVTRSNLPSSLLSQSNVIR